MFTRLTRRSRPGSGYKGSETEVLGSSREASYPPKIRLPVTFPAIKISHDVSYLKND
jgi:hypothetical protein